MHEARKLGIRALAPVIAALAVAALTHDAQAQVTSAQQSAIRSSCRSDFTAKCSGVTPGGKDALACLQKNVNGLSPACKTAVAATLPPPAPAAAKPAEAAPPKAVAAPAPAPVAPAAATATAAPVVSAPPPKAKVAPPPKAKAATAAVAAPAPPATVAASEAPPAPTAEQMKAIRFTCRREFANNCRGVPSGGAKAIDCLQRNAGKLTPDCKTSLAALGDARPAAPGTPPPAPAGTPKAPVVMTAVIGRSCMRDLLLHCRNIKVGDGRKIACLMERGPALSPLCKAALKITEPVR
jgi:hypothetical protein